MWNYNRNTQLKPMYSFGKWQKWKKKSSNIEFQVLGIVWLKPSIFWDAPKNFTISPTSGHSLLLQTSICLLKWFYGGGGLRLFSDVRSETAALFKRLIKTHLNPPILYYGFKLNIELFLFSILTWPRKIPHLPTIYAVRLVNNRISQYGTPQLSYEEQ